MTDDLLHFFFCKHMARSLPQIQIQGDQKALLKNGSYFTIFVLAQR